MGNTVANDGNLYTGVDAPIFDNEVKDEKLELQIQEQRQKLQEITPQLEAILAMIDEEIKSVMSIDRFTTATMLEEKDIRAELQAAALYKAYLIGLKSNFTLKLNETKKR